MLLDGRTLALIVQHCTIRLALRCFMPTARVPANDNRRRGRK